MQHSAVWYQNYAEAPACRVETTITHLADRLATWLLLPERPADPALVGNPVVADLNIYPDELESLLAKSETVLSAVNDMDL